MVFWSVRQLYTHDDDDDAVSAHRQSAYFLRVFLWSSDAAAAAVALYGYCTRFRL